MTPLINGINYSWGNISLIIFNRPIFGITAIDWKKKQDKKNNPGIGNKNVSRGYGLEECDASITFSYDEWTRIKAQAPQGNPLKIPPFDITVRFSGTGVPPTKVVLKMAEFMEDTFTGKAGDTSLPVQVPLIVGDIQ